MNMNNYINPYYFTLPPPNLNVSNTWSYNWSTPTQDIRVSQTHRLALPPPPPPPPLPYGSSSQTSPRSSTTASPAAYNSDSKSEQRPLPYGSDSQTTSRTSTTASPAAYSSNSRSEQRQPAYSSLTQGTYRSRRYSNNNYTTGQYKDDNTNHYSSSTPKYSSGTESYNSQSSSQYNTQSPSQYNTQSSGQYNAQSGQYTAVGSPYGRNYFNKRRTDSESEGLRKSNKKKKKPLSQNIPQRKDWSVTDAKRALMVEKDYNKRHKSQSLIIKFPDIELNRDIVSKFHSAIESVHFQQPSTPRFCFVTLNDAVDPEAVIKDLNRTPFGQGFLTAEFKKDREDEINIGPEDIDPLTLYVGNLAQEVTKEDMVNTYPKQKRIDIGYAKKMKYTRYAFVSFKCVDDSIEAFQKTHATQMYSKSLIVRFRRLNGTVGMPGEPKPQMPQKSDAIDQNGSTLNSSNEHNDTENHQSDMDNETSGMAPWEMVDVSLWHTDRNDFIKAEPEDSDYDDDSLPERKPPINYMSSFMPESLEVVFSLHKPNVKVEVKKEKDIEGYLPIPIKDDSNDSSSSVMHNRKQTTPGVSKQRSDNNLKHAIGNSVNGDNDCMIIPPEKIKRDSPIDKTNRVNTYDLLRAQSSRLSISAFTPISIKTETATPIADNTKHNISGADTPETIKIKNEPDADKSNKTDRVNTYDMLRALNSKLRNNPVTQVEVKRETSTPVMDETSNDSRGKTSSADTADSVTVKDEFEDKDDETNDADKDSSEDECDFNIDSILNNLRNRKKK